MPIRRDRSEVSQTIEDLLSQEPLGLYDHKYIKNLGAYRDGEPYAEHVASLLVGRITTALDSATTSRLRKSPSYKQNRWAQERKVKGAGFDYAHDLAHCLASAEHKQPLKEDQYIKVVMQYAGHHGGLVLPSLGTVVDYQVPLYQTSGNAKIDLVTWDDDAAVLRLVEAKLGRQGKQVEKENLLRAVLEVATYHRVFNPEKFVKEANDAGLSLCSKNVACSVLLVEGAPSATSEEPSTKGAYQEALELNDPKWGNLRQLCSELQVGVYCGNHDLSSINAMFVPQSSVS